MSPSKAAAPLARTDSVNTEVTLAPLALTRVPWASSLAVALLLVVWFAGSACKSLANKAVLRRFDFPLSVLLCQLLVQAATTAALVALGHALTGVSLTGIFYRSFVYGPASAHGHNLGGSGAGAINGGGDAAAVDSVTALASAGDSSGGSGSDSDGYTGGYNDTFSSAFAVEDARHAGTSAGGAPVSAATALLAPSLDSESSSSSSGGGDIGNGTEAGRSGRGLSFSPARKSRAGAASTATAESAVACLASAAAGETRLHLDSDSADQTDTTVVSAAAVAGAAAAAAGTLSAAFAVAASDRARRRHRRRRRLLAAAAAAAAAAHAAPAPRLRFPLLSPRALLPALLALLPFTCAHLAAHILAQYALAALPVWALKVAKALGPVFAVVLARALLGERVSLRAGLALAPIVLGVALAAVPTSVFNGGGGGGDGGHGARESVKLWGIGLGALSALMYVVEKIAAKKLFSVGRIDPCTLLVASNLLAAALLLPAWAIVEARHGAVAGAVSSADGYRTALLLVANGVVDSVLSVAMLLLLTVLTAVTHQVCQAGDRVTALSASIIVFGDAVAPQQAVGIVLALGGMALYGWARLAYPVEAHGSGNRPQPQTREEAAAAEAAAARSLKARRDLGLTAGSAAALDLDGLDALEGIEAGHGHR
jgi:drug/metabolite transporter (DMT)-like permease